MKTVLPWRVDSIAIPEIVDKFLEELPGQIEEHLAKSLWEKVKKAQAEITWRSFNVNIDGMFLHFQADALFEGLFEWLDEEPEETAQVIEELLPTLKKAVAELERRANDAR
jgi:hypothetical protein